MKPHNSFHCEYFVVGANSLFTLIVPKDRKTKTDPTRRSSFEADHRNWEEAIPLNRMMHA